MSVSESARATTAAESRFRLQAPNALPRSLAVIPLDEAARAMATEVAALGFPRARFVALADGPDWLARLGGQTRALLDAIEGAQAVVLIATAGADAAIAGPVAEAAAARGRMIVGLILDSEGADAAALERSLAALRPHAGMLVVAEGRDYVAAMLEALRA
jgi:hypothetical protein